MRLRTREATLLPSVFEVAETGIGIPPESMASVFEALRQADNSIAREFGGAGLGLTITKAMLGLLGCDLRVESKVGEGSVFRIHFPPS